MLLLAAFLSASAPVAASLSQVDAGAVSVERAAAVLEPHIEGNWLDGKPGTDRLAGAQWQAVQRWAADWINAHPHLRPEALAQAGKRFGEAWSISAMALGGGDVLVAASRYQIGTVFILGAQGRGQYRLRWSVADSQGSLDAKADHALSLWRPIVQNAPCPGDCRMIGGSSMGRLPNAADGSSRFWIEAYYAQQAGATIGRQLSLWSWREGRARPLLLQDFVVMADQAGAVLRGATLHVPAKRSWSSLYACGSCIGRETDLSFAIGPNAVRARPAVSDTPELDLIDHVFSQVLARERRNVPASPSALRVIRAQLGERLAEAGLQPKPLAGMVMGWKRWTAQGRLWACLSVDGAGATAFSFDRKVSRIAAARILDADACTGKGTRM
jgi:hypothetical protein